jgi:hypothetical protein
LPKEINKKILTASEVDIKNIDPRGENIDGRRIKVFHCLEGSNNLLFAEFHILFIFIANCISKVKGGIALQASLEC